MTNKALAHHAVATTLPSEPPACDICGAAGFRRAGNERGAGQWSVVYHHHSYEPKFWLDVVPVCRSCHMKIHHGQIPEPRTGELRVGARRNQVREAPPGLRLFGRMVREARKARNWTTADLGRAVGVNRSFISKIELGVNDVSVETFGRLGHILDLDLNRVRDEPVP